MTLPILAGGVFCDGMALANHQTAPTNGGTVYLEHYTTATPSDTFYSATQHIQLARHLDPDYGDALAMRLRLARLDQSAGPNPNFYRAEARALQNLVPWGAPCTYYWRGRIGEEMQNLGVGSKVIVLQAHDTNLALIGRFPTFDGAIEEDKLNLRFSRDSVPTGEVVYQKPVSPRMPIEFTMQIMWADDFHVPASQGWYRIYDGNEVVAQGGGLNTWLDPTGTSEPWCPFQKFGVYQAGYNYAWWQGKALDMLYSAAITCSGVIEPAVLRQHVGQRMAARSALPVTWG